MNVHISYKISKTSDLEKLINQQTEKLARYLQVFRPELVHLKGVIEENSARQGIAGLAESATAFGADGLAGNQPHCGQRGESGLRRHCRAAEEAQGAAAQPSQMAAAARLRSARRSAQFLSNTRLRRLSRSRFRPATSPTTSTSICRG